MHSLGCPDQKECKSALIIRGPQRNRSPSSRTECSPGQPGRRRKSATRTPLSPVSDHAESPVPPAKLADVANAQPRHGARCAASFQSDERSNAPIRQEVFPDRELIGQLGRKVDAAAINQGELWAGMEAATRPVAASPPLETDRRPRRLGQAYRDPGSRDRPTPRHEFPR
jgi:hypothetical protein